MPSGDILSGQRIANELRTASTSIPGMRDFLDSLRRQPRVSALPSSYVSVRQDIEEECRRIFRGLSNLKKNGLRIENDDRDYPWVERFHALFCFYLILTYRTGCNPRRLLHVLGLNPTFSVHVGNHMLHRDCPSMGLVVECGLTEENCFGDDIFPVRIQNAHLRRVSESGDPFEAYPEFQDLFLKLHLPNFLMHGGKVLLVLGRIAFGKLREELGLRKVELGRSLNHLEIYYETVSPFETLD